MPPCLTLGIIRLGLRVSGTIRRKEKRSLQQPAVVAVEKGTFGLPNLSIGT